MSAFSKSNKSSTSQTGKQDLHGVFDVATDILVLILLDGKPVRMASGERMNDAAP